MRKYLMRGLTAMAFGGAFVSCSHDMELDRGVQQSIQETYEEAFKTRFGEPAATQDWGFGARANTRVANKETNLWGDPAYGNWIIPDPLTDGQKTRVMAYFQANPNLTYEDPKLTNFFVQQVYKGNPNTAGAISSEQYTKVNGEKITGSDNMDWLYAGKDNDHIYDYNNGTWNYGNPANILNTGESTNDYYTYGKTHPDMITLMENSSTEYIAFGSSTGNEYHTNCCALAGWKVIETWAIAHKDSLEAIGKFGESLDDGWNRSFVGLDYENRTLGNLYSGNNAKALDFMRDNNINYILYDGKIKHKDEFTNFELTNDKGESVRYLDDDVANQAIGEYIKYDRNNNGTLENVTKDAYNYKLTKQQFEEYGIEITNQEADIYDLDMIMGYIRQGALPTQNNGNWVKIGGRDYVFSDWIVTLTEAKKQGDDPTPTPDTNIEKIRVIAEDLTVDTNTDFDFNDVVFDVIWNKQTSEVSVVLKAAGGTLPLYIDGREVHDLYSEIDPTITRKTMVNTYAENKGLNGKSGLPDITFTPSAWSGSTIREIANSISVYVTKTINGEEVNCQLTAPVGSVASKVAVGTDYDWCNERQDIDQKYSLSDGTSLFKEYVKGLRGDKWYMEFNKK